MVNLVDRVPSTFSLVPGSVQVRANANYGVNLGTDPSDSSTLLSLHVEVLPLGEVVRITYMALSNSENTDMGLIEMEPIQLSYTTIQQEGIGLMVMNGYNTLTPRLPLGGLQGSHDKWTTLCGAGLLH